MLRSIPDTVYSFDILSLSADAPIARCRRRRPQIPPVITMVPLPVAYLMAKALLVAHGEHVSIVGKLGTIWL